MPEPVSTALIVGTVLQGAGIVSGFMGDKSAKKRMRKVRRATLASMERDYREQWRQSLKEEAAVTGAQRAAVAGSGAVVGAGTSRLLEAETADEYRRARNLAAYAYGAERTATIEGMRASRGNYFSQLGSLASSAASAFDTYQKRNP